ncbi:MAG: 4-oxalocrotonate tautomerase [Mesorhizobium sp.]|nr:MAG: 4-oxalocrotonate tautomerase [Mesorhizobium sp.]
MPFVNIRLVKDVIADDPAGCPGAAAITGATGLTSKDVWVVFEEVAARDWFVGETDVETMRSKR